MSYNLDKIKSILVKAVTAEMQTAKSGVTSCEEFESVREVRKFFDAHNIDEADANNQLLMIVEKVEDGEGCFIHNNVFYVNLAEYSEAKRDPTHPAYWAMDYIGHILESAISFDKVFGTSKKNSFTDTPEVAKQLCTRKNIETVIPGRVIVYDVYV